MLDTLDTLLPILPPSLLASYPPRLIRPPSSASSIARPWAGATVLERKCYPFDALLMPLGCAGVSICKVLLVSFIFALVCVTLPPPPPPADSTCLLHPAAAHVASPAAGPSRSPA
ncbi:hypothetical protein CFE70_008699 [Pyrenophora teres f. teres 0-1]